MRAFVKIGGAALTAALVLAGGPVSAHHSFAMFDQKKVVSLVGTVTDFQWTNPHAFIEIDVPPAAGGPSEKWSVEMNSPNNLTRQGWKRNSVKIGDKVNCTINPLRDGNKGGLFIAVKLPDGKTLGDLTKAGGGEINVTRP